MQATAEQDRPLRHLGSGRDHQKVRRQATVNGRKKLRLSQFFWHPSDELGLRRFIVMDHAAL